MSDTRERIQVTFSNLLSIYDETSKMLLDSATVLSKHGYICGHGNTVGTEQSKNINNPEKWITPYAARYFENTEEPRRLIGVGIFFVDTAYDVIEPLLLFGDFARKIDKRNKVEDWQYWYLKEAWFSQVDDEQTGISHAFSDAWNLERGRVISFPLEDFTGYKILEDRLAEFFFKGNAG